MENWNQDLRKDPSAEEFEISFSPETYLTKAKVQGALDSKVFLTPKKYGSINKIAFVFLFFTIAFVILKCNRMVNTKEQFE